jgi:cellobiose PTS system EIIA component
MSLNNEEIIFQLILHGGNGRSFAMEAISAAKQGDYATAREKIAKANEELTSAHKIQTEIIQKETSGLKTDISLLMIHAQDHLMNALTIRDLAAEFVDLYESLKLSGGV